ncbi:MAG: hypothetical protein QOH42_2444 [Blastocatellia bacterium]|nr:hypothetical protein [Blastocatellia bacterium]
MTFQGFNPFCLHQRFIEPWCIQSTKVDILADAQSLRRPKVCFVNLEAGWSKDTVTRGLMPIALSKTDECTYLNPRQRIARE